MWGFGELREASPHETAARECAEETLGLLGPPSFLKIQSML